MYNNYAMRWRPSDRLIGAIPQRLPAVAQDAQFQFGGNFELLGQCQHDFSDMARWLEDAGLSYNTVSYKVSGSVVNPYWTIEGNSRRYWDSGTDFGNEILNVIRAHQCDVDVASIQFRVEAAPGAPTPEPFVGSPYPEPGAPTLPGTGLFDQIAAELQIQKSEAQLLVFGGAALLLVMVMKR